MKRDYYEILELERNASASDIKKSYRRLAMKYHPDRNPNDPDSTEAFTEVKVAYETLSDPIKKGQYDRYGHDAPELNSYGRGSGFHGSGNINDIFENLRNHYGFRGNLNTFREIKIPVIFFINGGRIKFQIQEINPNVGIEIKHIVMDLEKDTPIGAKRVVVDQKGKKHSIMLTSSDTTELRTLGNSILMIQEFDALTLASAESITIKHPNGKQYKININDLKIKNDTKLKIPQAGLMDINGNRGDFYIGVNLTLGILSVEKKKELREILKN